MINCRKRESEVLLKEGKGEHDYNIDSGDAIAFGVRKSKDKKTGVGAIDSRDGITAIGGYVLLRERRKPGAGLQRPFQTWG